MKLTAKFVLWVVLLVALTLTIVSLLFVIVQTGSYYICMKNSVTVFHTWNSNNLNVCSKPWWLP